MLLLVTTNPFLPPRPVSPQIKARGFTTRARHASPARRNVRVRYFLEWGMPLGRTNETIYGLARAKIQQSTQYRRRVFPVDIVLVSEVHGRVLSLTRSLARLRCQCRTRCRVHAQTCLSPLPGRLGPPPSPGTRREKNIIQTFSCQKTVLSVGVDTGLAIDPREHPLANLAGTSLFRGPGCTTDRLASLSCFGEREAGTGFVY